MLSSLNVEQEKISTTHLSHKSTPPSVLHQSRLQGIFSPDKYFLWLILNLVINCLLLPIEQSAKTHTVANKHGLYPRQSMCRDTSIHEGIP